MTKKDSKLESKTVVYEFAGQSVAQTLKQQDYEPSMDMDVEDAAETLSKLFGGDCLVTVSYAYRIKNSQKEEAGAKATR